MNILFLRLKEKTNEIQRGQHRGTRMRISIQESMTWGWEHVFNVAESKSSQEFGRGVFHPLLFVISESHAVTSVGGLHLA